MWVFKFNEVDDFLIIILLIFGSSLIIREFYLEYNWKFLFNIFIII